MSTTLLFSEPGHPAIIPSASMTNAVSVLHLVVLTHQLLSNAGVSFIHELVDLI
jgi:hypothetical protein